MHPWIGKEVVYVGEQEMENPRLLIICKSEPGVFVGEFKNGMRIRVLETDFLAF